MALKPQIVFHHIPKCGGMSIAAGLALSYYPLTLLRHGRKGFPAHLNAKAATEAAAALGIERYAYRRHLLEYHLAADKSGFIFGHYPFSKGAAERYGDQWAFVTLMRDPAKRWYSEYFWNHYKSHDYAKTELDIEEYLENEQGRRDARSYVNFLTDCADPSAPVSDAEFEAAKENLKYFTIIGSLENLPKFQTDMKNKFGRKPYFFRRNKSPAKNTEYKIPDPESDFHRKLLLLLEKEIEIYKYALEK